MPFEAAATGFEPVSSAFEADSYPLAYAAVFHGWGGGKPSPLNQVNDPDEGEGWDEQESRCDSFAESLRPSDRSGYHFFELAGIL